MDQKLLAWGRRVKARHKSRLPPLWLFTDAARLPDPEAAIAALPKGLCGVVFRHDGVPGRAALLRRVARICRARHLVLVVAGPAAPPPGAGRHLRAGLGPARAYRLRTSSAHGLPDLIRARRAGAALAFLSPAFPTESHQGAPALGPCRWSALARQSRLPTYALGGITGQTARLLPAWARGAGAIGALLSA